MKIFLWVCTNQNPNRVTGINSYGHSVAVRQIQNEDRGGEKWTFRSPTPLTRGSDRQTSWKCFMGLYEPKPKSVTAINSYGHSVVVRKIQNEDRGGENWTFGNPHPSN